MPEAGMGELDRQAVGTELNDKKWKNDMNSVDRGSAETDASQRQDSPLGLAVSDWMRSLMSDRNGGSYGTAHP